jgi:hypothetical protein
LYCVCGGRFFPSNAADSTGAYMSVCGCRLRPIDAATVERRVYTQAATFVSPPTTGCWRRRTMKSFARSCARIEVGGLIDDVRLVPLGPRPASSPVRARRVMRRAPVGRLPHRHA